MTSCIACGSVLIIEIDRTEETTISTKTAAAESQFVVIKTFDNQVEMPDMDFFGTRSEIHSSILDDLDWAENLCQGEVPGTVTLNTDRVADPNLYFLVWHMHDGTTQTDIFTVTPN